MSGVLTLATQRRLFGDGSEPVQATAPHSGSVTSREAAASVVGSVDDQKTLVLRFIQSRGPLGATDIEIQTGLRLSGDSQRPRRVALQQAGDVLDSGRRRLNPSGRQAIVWIARGNR